MFIPIVTLVLAIVPTITLGCSAKHFENAETFVCVCNQENCDSVNSLPHSLDGHLTLFVTDKSSHRLAKSLIHVDDLVYNSNELADVHVSIDTSQRQQSITGFGGAFTDATGINLNKLSGDLADKLIEDYFGDNGLQYTVCRVPLGGSDFSDRPYSYADTEGDYDLKTFTLAPDDFNYKIPYIKKAFNISSDLKLFASPWSPPVWLKTSKKVDGLGILEGEPGTKAWKTWANYFVKFFDAYHENGVDFWGFTPENEPNAGLTPGWRWNALGFNGPMMREFIKKDLGPALAEAGYTKDKLKLMILDENLPEAVPFVRAVLSDKEAAKYVSGVAFHWYFTYGNYEPLNEIHELFPDYFLLNTEACEGWFGKIHVSLGNWTRAENIAADVIEGLNRWSTGWVDWNMVLDENGGPNWAKNVVDGFIIVNSETKEYYKQPMYYAFGHFSKFLRPGSVHVSTKMTTGQTVDTTKIKMTTFVSPSNEVVVTILNRHESALKLLIDGVVGKPFSLTVEPHSITTLIRPMS